MIQTTLFDDGRHRWLALGRDPDRPDSVIDTNEYLTVSNDEAFLLDPGGTEIFPMVMASVSDAIPLPQLKMLFASHQDPDIISSLPLWLGLCPHLSVTMPRIWSSFIAHFDGEHVGQFRMMPDGGGTLTIGERGHSLEIIPAHYCHAAGNFSVYDPHAKILFSGDIGAGLVPPDHGMFVKDFQAHIAYMEGFHRRWMPSNEAKNAWVRRVRSLDVEMLCPQHGAIFRGDQVGQFLDWFESLEVGSALQSMEAAEAPALV